MEPCHHCKDPDHPEDAYAHASNHRRHHGITRTAHSACKNLHRHKYKIKGHCPQHYVSTHPDHLRVSGVNTENKGTERKQQCTQRTYQRNTHSHTHPHALADSVILLCTEILSNKSSDRNAKSTGYHPRQCISLMVGRPRRHGDISEGINAGLDQQISKIKGDKLQPRRDADK